MNKNEPPQILRIEPRWPVFLTILVVFGLTAELPVRVRLFPQWFVFIIAIAALTAIAAVPISGAAKRWRRIEHIVMLVIVAILGSATTMSVASLIREMVTPSRDLDGLLLLSSSVGMWVSNVLTFSLLFWQIDRGGSEARMNDIGKRPDFLFPQTGAPDEAPLDWRPTFVDYLFLSYTTATAFSPTDTLPMTSRAKLMMMVESSIALTTFAVVAARAINILGS
ncbi:MAG: hypothetical protein DCF20_02470 [Pseudanabaena sp.]|nr:MAG: hypothetical protein DCF20_02470 [Pseudanabaena sp.]